MNYILIFICSMLIVQNVEAIECSYQENLSNEELAVLFEGANEGQQQLEEAKIIPFAFLIKDSNQQIVGGVKGESFHDYLSVEILWVAAELRNQGWGVRLMQEAEQLARERNCRFITLTTGTRKALSFYEKCGFEVEFSKSGYTKDSCIYFLKKTLNEIEPTV